MYKYIWTVLYVAFKASRAKGLQHNMHGQTISVSIYFYQQQNFEYMETEKGNWKKNKSRK